MTGTPGTNRDGEADGTLKSEPHLAPSALTPTAPSDEELVAPTWRSRFIPIGATDLASGLVADAAKFGVAPDQMRCVVDSIEEALAIETRSLERSMADRYAPFNPDRDTLPMCQLPRDEWQANYAEFEKRIAYLFDKANFEQFDNVMIETAISEAKSHGLRIRIRAERVDKLVLWVRGRGVIYKRRWHWRAPRRGKNVKYQVFHRLGVLAKLKDDPHVNLRMFRDVPVADIEALLPHAEVQMSWFDRLKILGGGAGALSTLVIKLLQGALTLAFLSKLIWIAAMPFGLMAGRTFLGYKRNKSQRDAQRTQHLYYQTLANNGGVISWLIDMIGQEEEKEAMLAYAACRGTVVHGMPVEESSMRMKSRVEEYLKERYGVQIDFDSPDAIETLDRLNLCDSRESLCVVDPAEAAKRIKDYGESPGARTYHEDMVKKR